MTDEALDQINDAANDLRNWLETPEGAGISAEIGGNNASQIFLNIHRTGFDRGAATNPQTEPHFTTTT